jgi:hypothetical protein
VRLTVRLVRSGFWLPAILTAGVVEDVWLRHVNFWSAVITATLRMGIMLAWLAVVIVIFAIAVIPPWDRLAKSSVTSLTNLAALLAGSSRPALRDEWRAHLAGKSGHDPVTWRKVREALGFVSSAAQYRLADAADLAWRPADAVLGSRTLSNLFVWGPVIVTLFAIVHHDGRFGLVADIQDPAEMGPFLYSVIRTGRWWRGIKPPEPKARRARE